MMSDATHNHGHGLLPCSGFKWYQIPHAPVLNLHPIERVNISDTSNDGSSFVVSGSGRDDAVKSLTDIHSQLHGRFIAIQSCKEMTNPERVFPLLLKISDTQYLHCQLYVEGLIPHSNADSRLIILSDSAKENKDGKCSIIYRIVTSTKILWYQKDSDLYSLSKGFNAYFGIVLIDYSFSHSSDLIEGPTQTIGNSEFHTIDVTDYLEDSFKTAVMGMLSSSALKATQLQRSECHSIGTNPSVGNRSLLFLGESGSGGFTVAKSLSCKIGARVIIIRPVSSLIHSIDGRCDIVRTLREAFKCSNIIRRFSPCIIILDDLHTIMDEPEVSKDFHSYESPVKILLQRLKASTSTESSGLNHRRLQSEIIIGCSYRSSLVDPVLYKAFQERIVLSNPHILHRANIAMKLCKYHGLSDYSSTRVKSYAESISGSPFLVVLTRLMKRVEEELQSTMDTSLSNAIVDNSNASNENIDLKLRYQGVIGLSSVKRAIEETIVWRALHPQLFASFNISTEIGILLFGPPGTGKTLLPRVLAQELNYTLLNIRLTQVVQGEIGTGEQILVQIFHEAKQCSPSMIYIDEFQAIFTQRSSSESSADESSSTLSATLASCLDDLYLWNCNTGSMQTSCIVIAATNEPWAVDKSFLRSGRFQKKILVGPLLLKERYEYANHHIRSLLQDVSFQAGAESILLKDEFDKGNVFSDIIENIVFKTERFTGADMAYLFKRIANRLITLKGFQSSESDNGNMDKSDGLILSDMIRFVKTSVDEILSKSTASVTVEEMNDYLEWERNTR